MTSLVDIRERIQTLFQNTVSLRPESLTEHVYFKEFLYWMYQLRLLSVLWNCATNEDLRRVLRDNWQFVKGNNLCFTEHPEAPLTLIFCDVAQHLSKEFENVSPIELLMPGVITESIYDKNDSSYIDYPDLRDIPLSDVLKTHILSDTGSYLIPIRVLSELPGPLDNRANNQLANYYHKLDDETIKGFVTENEFRRLIQHSVHTAGLVNAKEEYAHFLNDAGLLTHLRALIRELRKNSTLGSGSEDAAGSGAYPALSTFCDYYNKLGDITEQIPEELNIAIKRLITISSNANENLIATKMLETCTAMRQNELAALVKKHEAKLLEISSDENKQLLLKQAIERFESTRETLLQLLKNNTYAGQDTLSISYHELVGLPFAISSRVFKRALQSLDMEQRTLLCQALKDHLPKIILWHMDFIDILNLLDIQGCSIVCEALKETMHKILKGGVRLASAYKDLSAEKYALVYNIVKEKLHKIIKTPYDYAKLMDRIDIDQCKLMCAALKPHLSRIIKKGADLTEVFEILAPNKIALVLEENKDYLVGIITEDDLILYDDKIPVVLKALQDKLHLIIKSPLIIGDLINSLNPLSTDRNFKLLNDIIPVTIKTTADLGNVLERIESLQYYEPLCKALNLQLPNLIKSSSDLRTIISPLSSEQRTMLIGALTEYLPEIIKSEEDLQVIQDNVSPHQLATLSEALKVQKPLSEEVKEVTNLLESTNVFTSDMKSEKAETRGDQQHRADIKSPKKNRF